MNLRQDPRISVRLLTLACVALLAFVTSVAAAHFCELQSYGGRQAQSAAVGPSSTTCPICALAHSPSLAAPVLPFTPHFLVAEVAAGIPTTPSRSFPGFVLHVRPPPAA